VPPKPLLRAYFICSVAVNSSALTAAIDCASLCAAADRRVEELEQQVASLEKATNDDTQSEDRRGLLMKAERAQTRAQKMEQQVRAACQSS
jgi:hypothetical protein